MAAAWGVSLWLVVPSRALDPRLPLCRQMALDIELVAALTPVPLGFLGVPEGPHPAPRVNRHDDHDGPAPVTLGPTAGTGLPGAVVIGPSVGGTPGAVRLGAPVLVTPMPAGLVGLLGRLRAGEESPEVSAALARQSAAALRAALADSPWWSHDEDRLRDRLVSALLERGDLDPLQSNAWSRDLTLKVADALQRRSDERCVALYQHLLDADAQVRLDDWVPELYGLAVYHRNRGEWAPAVAMWLAANRYTTSPAVCDDFRLEAARDLRHAGDAAGADKIEDTLLASKSGATWVIGLVTFSRAQRLLLAGKDDELRALLKTPLGLPGNDGAAVQVALDGILGDSYLRTGERDLARAQYTRVVAGYAALTDARSGSGLENIVAAARRRLAELDDRGKG
jgi:hypothetical protein